MPVRVDFDLDQVEKICRLHPSDKEVAAFFEVSLKTVQRKKKNKDFLRAMDKGKAHANMSLRRKQFETALNGNITMLIWLGKQYLSQTDKIEQEIKSDMVKPIDISIIDAS